MIELPKWLEDISFGLDEHRKIRVLLENERYAVVQIPGGVYASGQNRLYGSTTFYLVSKQALPTMRLSVGLLDASILQEGGRAKLAQWKKMIEGAKNEVPCCEQR